MSMKNLYTAAEASALLGISINKVRVMIKRGELKSVGKMVVRAAIEEIVGQFEDKPLTVVKEETAPVIQTAPVIPHEKTELEIAREKLEVEKQKIKDAAELIKLQVELDELAGKRDTPEILKQREEAVVKREETVSKREFDCDTRENGLNQRTQQVTVLVSSRKQEVDNYYNARKQEADDYYKTRKREADHYYNVVKAEEDERAKPKKSIPPIYVLMRSDLRDESLEKLIEISGYDRVIDYVVGYSETNAILYSKARFIHYTWSNEEDIDKLRQQLIDRNPSNYDKYEIRRNAQ